MNLFPPGIKATCTLACLLVGLLGTQGRAEPLEQATVEAAITLQLLGFTEWPDNPPGPKTIGIVSTETSYAAFEALLSDQRFGDRFAIVRITPQSPNDELFRCDALFFGEPDPVEIPRIFRKLEDRPVVLIGTFEGFLEQGGLVNLIKRQKRLGFEIHLDHSERRGIEYRAKLLRLATRIVQP